MTPVSAAGYTPTFHTRPSGLLRGLGLLAFCGALTLGFVAQVSAAPAAASPEVAAARQQAAAVQARAPAAPVDRCTCS